MLKSKKVRDFLRCIHSPELTAAVQQVKTSPLMSASFPQAVSFIALSVTPVKVSQRTIGALNQELSENTIALIDAQATASSSSGLGYNRPARGRASYRGRNIPPGGRMPCLKQYILLLGIILLSNGQLYPDNNKITSLLSEGQSAIYQCWIVIQMLIGITTKNK